MKLRKNSHEQIRVVAKMIRNQDWTVGFNIGVLAFSEFFIVVFHNAMYKRNEK